jgi:hypothetical protein
MKTTLLNITRCSAAIACLLAVTHSATAATLTWTTARDTASGTTNQLRSVAASDQPGNNSIYTGYIQTSLNRRLDRLDSSNPYSVLNTHPSGGDQPKGIATDDRGNVFVANRGSSTTSSRIQSFSSTLTPNSTTSATTPVIGGLAIQKSGATYYAYAVYEGAGLIQRYDVTNPAAMSLDVSFGTGGSYNIPGASDLRGVEVGADGSLFVASRGDGDVYRVSSDLSTVVSFPLNRAMDVALYGGNIYATSYDGVNSFIRVINASNMAFVEDIAITTLDGNPYSRGASEGFSGIDIDAAGTIWLADQHYGSTGGTQDRLLVATGLAVPEPGSLALSGLAIALFAVRCRRAKC